MRSTHPVTSCEDVTVHCEKGSHHLRLRLTVRFSRAKLSGGLTEDEGNLDLGQVEEVLGDVDGDLVQEGWGNVETVLNVVQVSARLRGAGAHCYMHSGVPCLQRVACQCRHASGIRLPPLIAFG